MKKTLWLVALMVVAAVCSFAGTANTFLTWTADPGQVIQWNAAGTTGSINVMVTLSSTAGVIGGDSVLANYGITAGQSFAATLTYSLGANTPGSGLDANGYMVEGDYLDLTLTDAVAGAGDGKVVIDSTSNAGIINGWGGQRT